MHKSTHSSSQSCRFSICEYNSNLLKDMWVSWRSKTLSHCSRRCACFIKELSSSRKASSVPRDDGAANLFLIKGLWCLHLVTGEVEEGVWLHPAVDVYEGWYHVETQAHGEESSGRSVYTTGWSWLCDMTSASRSLSGQTEQSSHANTPSTTLTGCGRCWRTHICSAFSPHASHSAQPHCALFVLGTRCFFIT